MPCPIRSASIKASKVVWPLELGIGVQIPAQDADGVAVEHQFHLCDMQTTLEFWRGDPISVPRPPHSPLLCLESRLGRAEDLRVQPLLGVPPLLREFGIDPGTVLERTGIDPREIRRRLVVQHEIRAH